MSRLQDTTQIRHSQRHHGSGASAAIPGAATSTSGMERETAAQHSEIEPEKATTSSMREFSDHSENHPDFSSSANTVSNAKSNNQTNRLSNSRLQNKANNSYRNEKLARRLHSRMNAPSHDGNAKEHLPKSRNERLDEKRNSKTEQAFNLLIKVNETVSINDDTSSTASTSTGTVAESTTSTSTTASTTARRAQHLLSESHVVGIKPARLGNSFPYSLVQQDIKKMSKTHLDIERPVTTATQPGLHKSNTNKAVITIPVEKPIEIGKSAVYKWVVKSYQLATDSRGQSCRIPIYASLGGGMYGQVFEVQRNQTVYAAKVIYMNDRNNPHVLSADTLREIALYQELNEVHANAFPHLPNFYGFKIVHVFSDYFAERYLSKCKRCAIIILEKCEQTFRHFTAINSSRINVNWIKFYLWQLLNALAKLHSQDLSHRDLKPDNLLMSPVKGTNNDNASVEYFKGLAFLKVSDLGMGRKLRHGFSINDAGANGPIEFFDSPKEEYDKETLPSEKCEMAQTGVVITLPYRPPELLIADALLKDASGSHIAHYGKACDMWSAGVIFGELCLIPPSEAKYWKYLFYSRKYEGAYHGKIFMMLTNIFKLLGSPSESDCANLKSINKSQWPTLEPYFASFPCFSDLERLYSLEKVIKSHNGVRLDYYGLDLLSRLLDLNPSKRLSATDALAHPFFESLPYEEMNALGFIFWMNHLENPNFCRYLKPYSREQLKAWQNAGGSLKDTKLGLHIHQRSRHALHSITSRKAELRSASQSNLPSVQKTTQEEKYSEEHSSTANITQSDIENQTVNVRRIKRITSSTSALPSIISDENVGEHTDSPADKAEKPKRRRSVLLLENAIEKSK